MDISSAPQSSFPLYQMKIKNNFVVVNNILLKRDYYNVEPNRPHIVWKEYDNQNNKSSIPNLDIFSS